MAKNEITISLEEYKELLLRERPTDKDRELLTRISNIVLPHLKYSDYKYDSYRVMEDVKLENADDVLKEIFTMIKYVDFERYMEIWNGVMTAERKRKEQQELIEQMNRAKEIRKENNNECE